MVRDFRPSDQPEVRRLILDGLRERWGATFDPERNPDLDDLVMCYLDQGSQIVVIQAGDEIVATGILVAEAGNTGRILRMSVSANRRRQRLGRRVVDDLLARARHGSMSLVSVSTDTPWISAVELYRRRPTACE